MTLPVENSSKRPKVLLIGWDGADWEHITPLLDQGYLPTLEKLINAGVMGNLSTLEPVLSPMLWNSVATGKLANKHGIYGFIERDPDNGGARPFSSVSRKTKALWNILSQSGYRSNIINWWASHPAEPIHGCIVSNLFSGVKFHPETGWKIAKGTIHPERLEQPFAKFKFFPEELVEEHILPFIPNAANIDQTEDSRLTGFAKTLAETITTQSIATAVMATEPWDFMAIYYTGIDHFCHGFMQYHPPKMPTISDADFEMYKGVIEGAYRFHDMMLEALLSQVDDDTTVVLCSDHGFHSRDFRPLGVPREPTGPAIWHRKYGIIVMKGPGIKVDERIYGASLIDVGPTILTLFGLPLGEDMDGRPLIEAFESPPEIKTVPSWDDIPGEDGMHKELAPMSKEESLELLKQFAALGYIDDPSEDREKQAKDAEIECQYNLARVYISLRKYQDALTILTDLVRESPWENRFIVLQAECYLMANYALQAKRVIDSAFNLETTHLSNLLLLYSKIMLVLGDQEAALKYLKLAEVRLPRMPEVYCGIGDLYLMQRRWQDAERNYRKAIELNADNAIAWQSLSTVALRVGANQEAVDAAFQAIGLLYRLPRAHFNLGLAFLRSGNSDRAAMAFQTAVKFAPRMMNAHRFLARIYEQSPATRELADKHRRQVQLLLTANSVEAKTRAERKEQVFDIPDFGTEEERIQRIIKERPNPQDKVEKSGKSYIVVSGLPRSGTSLMMQLLEAGGIQVITDGERVADVDNPKGYYEWEAIKQVADKPEILDDEELNGRVFKGVSVLLKHLPKQHDYKVIFMTRPIDEIVESQATMINRLGTSGAELDKEDLRRGLKLHSHEMLKWMKGTKYIEALIVDYPTLVSKPNEVIPAICDFLGEKIVYPERMSEVIDAKLYRNRVAHS
ncbi:MAG TPA: alkaline phosphatase family protein [Pirellulaceae bacterium]|nr:alkaline phosphatase family protein [Pirellulaceae bacterium]HMP69302.1 alkaline phosphatase family protein [Pirellulaceae bacterium]